MPLLGETLKRTGTVTHGLHLFMAPMTAMGIDSGNPAEHPSLKPAGHADIGHDSHHRHRPRILDQRMHERVINDNFATEVHHEMPNGVLRHQNPLKRPPHRVIGVGQHLELDSGV